MSAFLAAVGGAAILGKMLETDAALNQNAYESAMANYNAAREDQLGNFYNAAAVQQRQEGQAAKQKSVLQTNIYQTETKKLLGKEYAGRAASGVRAGTGSALDSYANLSANRAYEQAGMTWMGDVAQWEANVSAWKSETEGAIHLDRAKLLRSQADYIGSQQKMIALSGMLNMVGTGQQAYAKYKTGK